MNVSLLSVSFLLFLLSPGVRGYAPKKCPAVPPLPKVECAGRQTDTCWSAGVRDLDCPGSALCCFDGCANTCLLDNDSYGSSDSYPTPSFIVPYQPFHPPFLVPQPLVAEKPKCPSVYPKTHYECIAKTEHTCWNLGSTDTDCPYNGLCCFDGCANTCLENKEREIDPCNPSPCGPGTTCSTNKHKNPICKCLPGLVPKPDTITGCGPECLVDSDCKYDLVCEHKKCIEKPDPCSPTPCGPGTTCKVNFKGNPVCNCLPGLIPKPDTISGCGPECSIDSDCKVGYVCLANRCVDKPDPCNPSPCGPGTSCKENYKGNPVCQCLPGLIPKPDTITGCGPECTVDSECNSGYICQNNRCIERPDPCDPSPCGPGTTCKVNSKGNPVCQCLARLVPKPDTITGCGPECVLDADCKRGYICQDSICIEKPDPCDPSPCGPGTKCMPNGNGNPVCQCLSGLVPKPDTITGCGPECQIDRDCKENYICQSQRCIEKPDPCDPSPCGPGAQCMENSDGNPVCRCLPGLVPKPDTITGCGPECVVDSDCKEGYVCQLQRCIVKPDPCNPSPCGPGAFCALNINGNPVCKCEEGLVPKPDTITGCGPECVIDSDCKAGFICKNSKCMERPDPCDPNPCGAGALCEPVGHTGFRCVCPVGFFGDADVQCRRKDCDRDEDCSLDKFCDLSNYTCANPCTMMQSCGDKQFCRVVNHEAICGFNQAPKKLLITEKPFVIGSRHAAPPPPPSARERFVIGARFPNRRPEVKPRKSHIIGGEYKSFPGHDQGGRQKTVRIVPKFRKTSSSRNSFPHVIGAKYRRRKRKLF